MAKPTDTFDVYLEVGQKKTFAVALDWPGWARSGRDADSALQALLDYGPRYSRAMQRTRLGFHPPSDLSAFSVVEQQPGTATTDFGAPDVSLSRDDAPADDDDLKRWQTILRACWRAFDAAVEAADGRTLRKGPRGGGRDLNKIVGHVAEVDKAYVAALGGKLTLGKDVAPNDALTLIRDGVLSTLEAAIHGEIPAEGPRGGKRWTPRYFVRRLAWHELDHAWEIEDRAE